MAKAVETGMPKGAMRKMLLRSGEDGIGCAVGVGDNPAFGLLVMHRIRRGKALETMLKADFPAAKTVRFGMARVDRDENPKLVRLSLNRGASGLARKLIKTLKGTGFNKVIIVSDDGETDSYEEEDEEALVLDGDEEADAAAPAPEPPPAPPPSAAPPAPPPPPPSAPPPAPPPPAPAADTAAQAAQLGRLLAGLAATIPARAEGNPEWKVALVKLATDANVNLKTGNLKAAGGFVAELKKALDGGPAVTAAAAGLADATLDRVRVEWAGMRQQVAADVEVLRAALAGAYAGQPFADQVVSAFKAKADPMLSVFDERLGTALEAVKRATGPLDRSATVAAAKGIVREYLTFAAGDPFITDLDSNPFTPLTIRKKTTAALADVAKAITA